MDISDNGKKATRRRRHSLAQFVLQCSANCKARDWAVTAIVTYKSYKLDTLGYTLKRLNLPLYGLQSSIILAEHIRVY